MGGRAMGDLWQVCTAMTSSHIPQMPGMFTTIVYGLGAIPAIYAFLAYPSVADTRREQTRILLDAVTVLIVAGAFGWYLLIGPHLTGELKTKELLLALSQLGVLLLTTFAALRVIMSWKRPIGRATARWGVVALLFLIITEALTPFTLGTWALGLAFAGRIVVVLLHVFSARAQECEMEMNADPPRRKPKRPYSILPYASTAALGGLLLYALGRDDTLTPGTWGVVAASLACAAVVVTRQLSAFTDNANLLSQLDKNLVALEASISREREANRARQALEIQLRHAQKLEALGKLSAGMAHEINTPVQYMLTNVAFLRDSFETLSTSIDQYKQGRSDEIDESELEFLLTEVPMSLTDTTAGLSRVAQIVSSMRSFSGEGLNNNPICADLNRLLTDTLATARHEIEAIADVVFDAGELPGIVCNPSDLNQAWLELIINSAHALRASDKARGLITIKTYIEEDNSTVVEISDDGCGMSPEIMERIFDPFFTTKTVGSGTGQGLTVARSIIVDGHGGSIDVSSIEGEGTTFRIKLPVNGPLQKTALQEQAPQHS